MHCQLQLLKEKRDPGTLMRCMPSTHWNISWPFDYQERQKLRKFNKNTLHYREEHGAILKIIAETTAPSWLESNQHLKGSFLEAIDISTSVNPSETVAATNGFSKPIMQPQTAISFYQVPLIWWRSLVTQWMNNFS